MRGYEPIIKDNIQTLCAQLLGIVGDSSAAVEPNDSERWSAPRNMAKWSKLRYEGNAICPQNANHIPKLGSYFSFDIMTDVTFSQRKSLMTRLDNRGIIDVIHSMMNRVGVISQIPTTREYKADRVILPKGFLSSLKFKQEVQRIAMARINEPQEGRRDVFQNLLDAKDPESGQSLPLPELLSECGVLIVAGKSLFKAERPQSF